MIKDTLPKLMSELKLNDNMLAKITGLSSTAISSYRRGISSPTDRVYAWDQHGRAIGV